MPSGPITKRTVDACEPGDRQLVLWDSKLKGFGLLVLPSGSKSYVYQYRIGGRGGRLRRYTIGRHGSPWTPDGARKRAEELAEAVRKGIDPMDAERADRAAKQVAQARELEEERRSLELSFADYVEKYLSNGLKADTRARTREGYASALRRHVTPLLRDKALPEIKRSDIVRVMDGIAAKQPAVRRIVFAVMRMLFNWAKNRGDISASPLEGMESPPLVSSRDRVLTDEELTLVLRAADQLERPFGPLYRLLFATGQRREEVAGLQWNELDRSTATWTLPAKRSKNSEANIVPLNSHAMVVLDRIAAVADMDEPKWPRKGFVFTTTGKRSVSGYSRAKARLDAKMVELARRNASERGEDPEAITIEPWRLHDARRTLATTLQRLGVRFEVTEAVLNHTAGASRSGVAAVYQRHSWGPEKRAALEAWAAHCDRLIDPASDEENIVQLRAAQSSLVKAR